MYNLLLFERVAVDTDGFRGNITNIATNWRRSIRAWGGFWTGDFSVTQEQVTQYELIDLFNGILGCRIVEVNYGITTWEGEIVQLRLTLDGVTWLRSLDSIRWRNKVKVQWGGGETAWSEDTDSSGEYGESCHIDQASAVFDATTAEARRDKILAHDAFPRTHTESGIFIDPSRSVDAGANRLDVMCAGYVFSMNRRYQESNIAAANISANISTLVGNSEFVTAGEIETNSTQSAVVVAGTPTRLWDCIRELIDIGDGSGNDYVGGVYAGREFDYAAAETSVTHYLRNGRLYDATGNYVLPPRVKPDMLVEIQGAPRSRTPPGGNAWDKPNRVYIDEVEFAAPDRLTLIPRSPEPIPETLNEMTRRVIGFSDKYAAFRHSVSAFRTLPGLRGLWVATEFDTSGNWEDQSRYDLTLTLNGNPTFNYDGLIPYAAFDGTGDYFSRSDEAATSITGTESHIDSSVRGLTLGGWFYTTDTTASQMAITKWAGGGNYSYFLALRGDVAGDPVMLRISDDGTTTATLASSNGYSSATWHFIVGRFNDNDTGEELAIFLDAVKTTVTTAMASIDDNASDFEIGASSSGSDLLTGRVSIAFLCSAAIPDDMIGALFQQSRALYGV